MATRAAPTFVRWMWIWITVLALVVVVVIGFLLGITSALNSIDDGLFEADRAVTGAGGDTKPLPGYVADINGNLAKIDAALKPIPNQADDILGSLRSIDGTLGSVDGSLKDTTGSLADTSGKLGNITSLLVDTSGTLVNISGSLVDTTGTLGNTSAALRGISASLVDTSNQLVSVRGTATRIRNTLNDAQRVGSNGTNRIWRRVRFINGGPFLGGGNNTRLGGSGANPNGLNAVKADTGNILGGLREVNKHLTSICQSTLLQIAAPGPC